MTLLPTYAILIILIKDINIYNKYKEYININKDKDKYIYNIYRVVNLLFKEKESFSLDELEIFFFSNFPTLKEEDVKTYQSIFGSLREAEIGDDLLLKLLKDIEARSKAEQIAMLAFDVAEGKKDPQELASQLEAFTTYKVDEAEDKEDETYVPSLAEILERRAKEPGLRWRLKTLNRMLGSLRQGNYGFMFARPESGKTTFLASEITFMAEQCSEEHPVLWFNNEEERDAVALRIITGALGVSQKEYELNIPEFDAKYSELLGKRLILVDDAAITKSKAERLIKKFQPKLVVFDQMSKMQGFEADREDLKLGAIHQWGRYIAKTYCATIAIGQADGTAEGVKWLHQSHVANAKTAIQAECDWILGMGKTHREEEEFVRFFHFSKNKLPGDTDTEVALRHGRQAVLIDPETARYKDIE